MLLTPLGANGMENQHQAPTLLDLPPELTTQVIFYLTEEENGNFRQTCESIKNVVDSSYRTSLQKYVNKISKDSLLTDPVLNINYLNQIMRKICALYIKNEGYLFVPKGSFLEGYLSNTYQLISLHPFLENNAKDWARNLFKAIFGKDMAEDKFDLSLNLLTACLPINHIYADKTGEDLSFLLEKFKEKNADDLLKALKKMNEGQRYFLVGIDTDISVLNEHPHLIVVNQSHSQELRNLEEYLPEGHPHTLLYNADQEVLFFPNPPQNIGSLILTNGNNQCTSIGARFLGYSDLFSQAKVLKKRILERNQQ